MKHHMEMKSRVCNVLDLVTKPVYLNLMRIVLSLIAAWVLSILPAQAGNSPWFDTDGARMRLVSMPSADGKTIDAGLQFELQPDWKTYWRSPGSSGLPPQVNFLGSQNAAKVEMKLPVPSLFRDGNGISAGYKDSVTFPISVEPLYPGRPVVLKANGVVGICGTICVPVQFSLELTETGSGVVPADVVRPIVAANQNLIHAASDQQRVEEVVFDPQGSNLMVNAKVPEGTREASIFVEGPFNWYLSPVKASSIDGPRAVFSVSLADMPKDAAPEKVSLRFTLVADGAGTEQELTPVLR